MRRPAFILIAIIFLELFAAGCEAWIISRSLFFHQSPSYFAQVLEKAGMRRENLSAGISWADYDNDGNIDLVVAGRQLRLFHNNGNATFTDVTKKAGLLMDTPIGTAVFGDYNNDGCRDLFVANRGGDAYKLYRNNCNGTFSEVKNAFPDIGRYHTWGAAWGDYDNDGYLDLYIANYGYQPDDNEYQSEPNLLFHNNGNGTFTNVIKKAKASGHSDACNMEAGWVHHHKILGGPYKESYQPVWFDYNNDGKLDLFVANDSGVSPLYKNNGDGTFTEVTRQAGLCRLGTGMGVTVGDYDNDGYLDIYVTNTGAKYLWHNKGNGTFEDVGAKVGVADPLSIGWGANFFDYDNDGNLDLYVVNGNVSHNEPLWDPNLGKDKTDRLYRNNGNGSFTDVAKQVGILGNDPKEAAAFADFNNDGFIDMYVASSEFVSPRDRLYQNHPNGNHWITSN